MLGFKVNAAKSFVHKQQNDQISSIGKLLSLSERG